MIDLFTPSEKFRFDSKSYQQMGFYKVVENAPSNTECLEQLIENHRTYFNDRIEEVKKLYVEKLAEIEENINQKLDKKNEAKEKISLYSQKKEELKISLRELNTELVELHKTHDELRRQLGMEQKQPVLKRIKEASEELTQLVENYHTLLALKFPKNSPSLQNALEEQIKFFTDFKNQAKESYTQFKEKVDKLHLTGFGRLSAKYMIGAGITASTASGWFFSIFIVENKFDSQSSLFFILSGLFGLGEEFFGIKQHSKLYGGMIMTLVFLLSLLIITLVVRWVESLRNQIADKKNRQNFAYNAENEKLFFSIKIDAENFYSFWLQSLPWILVCGLVFIAIVIGNSSTDLVQLGTRLSAQWAGTIITLLTGGFITLYYSKIIEPRAEKNNTTKWTIKIFIELFIAQLFFVFVILFSLIGEAFTGPAQTPSGITSLLIFLSINIIASLTIAFGIRLKDSFDNLFKAEKQLLYVVKLIPVLANKVPLPLWYNETARFTEKLLEIEEELMGMILVKAQWKPRKESYLETKIKNTFSISWLRSISQKYKREQLITPIDSFEKKYFPEISSQIENVQTSISNNNGKRETILHDIKDIEEESSTYLRSVISDINQSENDIKTYLSQKTELYEKQFADIDFLKNNAVLLEIEIKKGYDLGRWWLQKEQ